MRILVTTGALALMMAGPAFAQGATTVPGSETSRGTVVEKSSGATGGAGAVTISRGGTGADTVNTDAAAGSNAGQPSRAVPQGGGGAGGSGG